MFHSYSDHSYPFRLRSVRTCRHLTDKYEKKRILNHFTRIRFDFKTISSNSIAITKGSIMNNIYFPAGFVVNYPRRVLVFLCADHSYEIYRTVLFFGGETNDKTKPFIHIIHDD